jgi:hypothetical protein
MNNEFTIRFIGIVMFLSMPIAGVQDARHVVLPFWGTDRTVTTPAAIAAAAAAPSPASPAGTNVEKHIPYIAFTTASCNEPPCATVAEFAGAPVPFTRRGEPWSYIPLHGYHLEVENPRNPLRISDSHRQRLPRLREYCDTFVLPSSFASDTLKDPRKAATIDIATGTLSAEGNVSLDEGVVSVWKTVVLGNLVINATPHGDPNELPADAKKVLLELKPGGKVEIGNAPEALIPDPTHRGHPSTPNHFLVYYAVSDDPDTRTAANNVAVTRCDRKPGKHSKLSPVPGVPDNSGRLPSADCSNSQYP